MNLQTAEWLRGSFRARIIIWEYTAERVLDHPWLGIGAASTPALREPRDQSEKPSGYVYPRNTGQHAHNMFLQTWYELGAAGVLLIAIAGAIVAFRIALLPIETQPFAAASFAVFFVDRGLFLGYGAGVARGCSWAPSCLFENNKRHSTAKVIIQNLCQRRLRIADAWSRYLPGLAFVMFPLPTSGLGSNCARRFPV